MNSPEIPGAFFIFQHRLVDSGPAGKAVLERLGQGRRDPRMTSEMASIAHPAGKINFLAYRCSLASLRRASGAGPRPQGTGLPKRASVRIMPP